MTDADIAAAREVIAAASKGPKRWVVNTSRPDCTLEDQIKAMFAPGNQDECHGVAMPADGMPAESLDGGDALYLAITGNGATSAANARYIAGSFDSVAGWSAALDEVKRLRAMVRDLVRDLVTAKAES